MITNPQINRDIQDSDSLAELFDSKVKNLIRETLDTAESLDLSSVLVFGCMGNHLANHTARLIAIPLSEMEPTARITALELLKTQIEATVTEFLEIIDNEQ